MAEADLSFRRGCLADFASCWRGLRKFHVPHGRSSRTELVLLAIVPQFVMILLAIVAGFAFEDRVSSAALVFGATAIALVPLPMAMVRRLHDMSKSGWLAIPGLALIGIGMWDAWLDVVATGYPLTELWHNRPNEELLYGFVSLSYVAFLMLPPRNERNPYGPDPRPAPRTI